MYLLGKLDDFLNFHVVGFVLVDGDVFGFFFLRFYEEGIFFENFIWNYELLYLDFFF